VTFYDTKPDNKSMVNCSEDIVLNGMNRDRTKEEMLDPIAIERERRLLVDCLGVHCLLSKYSYSKERERWLICRKLCYRKNSVIANSPGLVVQQLSALWMAQGDVRRGLLMLSGPVCKLSINQRV